MYQCTERDRAAILRYLDQEPEMNLFFFGDIENYGVDCDPVHVYANPDADGWDFLLLQYYDFYILYSRKADYDASAAARFLLSRRVDSISGKLELIQRLAPWFPALRLRPTYMSRCNVLTPDSSRMLPQNVRLRRLGEQQLTEVTDLLVGIAEFADSYKGEDGWQRCMRGNAANLQTGMLYGLYVDGVLAATAQTSAANSRSAMVVAVATKPEFRGRGYASAVVSALCHASFESGLQFLCLFYNNPAAGRIYRRLGFAEIGRYAMLQ